MSKSYERNQKPEPPRRRPPDFKDFDLSEASGKKPRPLGELIWDPNVDISDVKFKDVTEEWLGKSIQIIGGVQPQAESSANWEFKLNFERGEIIYEPTDARIQSGIASLRVVEGDSYCILERRDVGFVQAMCGVNGIHVEWCDVYNKDWKNTDQYKAGHHQPPKEPAKCTKAIYMVPGFDNELLSRDDARVVFLAYRHLQRKPTAYVWRKMTDEELS